MAGEEMTVHRMIELLREERPEARVEMTARRGKDEYRGSIIVECVVYDDDEGTRAPLLWTPVVL